MELKPSKEALNKDGLKTAGKPVSTPPLGPNNNKKKPKKQIPAGMVGVPKSYFESINCDYECSIRVKPKEVKFGPRDFWITLYVKNTSQHRVCFKIHPPNPKFYTVTPLSGFVEPGKQSFVAINRLKAVENTDKLTVEYGADTGVEQAAVFFDDRYVNSDEVIVNVVSLAP